jgi:hypothetical protein
MAINVVQSMAGGQGTSSLTFSSAVTAGNSVVLIAQGYNSNTSSSNPTYNGTTPIGSIKLAELNPSTYYTYAGIWLMPNLAGGSTTTGISITPSGSNGFTAIEIAGLGTKPRLDANGGYSLGYGATSGSGMPSGYMPALATSSALLIGTGAAYGVSSYVTSGGWTNVPNASYSVTQYQIVTNASGNTYQYDPSGGSAGWGSAIIALYNTGSGSLMAGLL